MEKVQPEIILIKTSSSSSSIGIAIAIGSRQRRRLEDAATQSRVAATRRGVQSSARFSRRICHDLFILIDSPAIYLATTQCATSNVPHATTCHMQRFTHFASRVSRLRNLCEFNGSSPQIDWHFLCASSPVVPSVYRAIGLSQHPQKYTHTHTFAYL